MYKYEYYVDNVHSKISKIRDEVNSKISPHKTHVVEIFVHESAFVISSGNFQNNS